MAVSRRSQNPTDYHAHGARFFIHAGLMTHAGQGGPQKAERCGVLGCPGPCLLGTTPLLAGSTYSQAFTTRRREARPEPHTAERLCAREEDTLKEFGHAPARRSHQCHGLSRRATGHHVRRRCPAWRGPRTTAWPLARYLSLGDDARVNTACGFTSDGTCVSDG